MLELETLVDSDCVRVCCWRSLLVQLWLEPPLRYHQELVANAFETMIERHGEPGFSTLTVVRMTKVFGSPEAGVRERSKALFERVDGYVELNALALEAPGGLAGRSLRTFIRALLLITRPQAETRTFDRVEPALDWLVAHERAAAEFADARAGLADALAAWL